MICVGWRRIGRNPSGAGGVVRRHKNVELVTQARLLAPPRGGVSPLLLSYETSPVASPPSDPELPLPVRVQRFLPVPLSPCSRNNPSSLSSILCTWTGPVRPLAKSRDSAAFSIFSKMVLFACCRALIEPPCKRTPITLDSGPALLPSFRSSAMCCHLEPFSKRGNLEGSQNPPRREGPFFVHSGGGVF